MAKGGSSRRILSSALVVTLAQLSGDSMGVLLCRITFVVQTLPPSRSRSSVSSFSLPPGLISVFRCALISRKDPHSLCEILAEHDDSTAYQKWRSTTPGLHRPRSRVSYLLPLPTSVASTEDFRSRTPRPQTDYQLNHTLSYQHSTEPVLGRQRRPLVNLPAPNRQRQRRRPPKRPRTP